MSLTRLSAVLGALFCLIGFLGPTCTASKHNSTVYLESIINDVITITHYHSQIIHKLSPNIESPPWQQMKLHSSTTWSGPSNIRSDLANILSNYQKPLMTITIFESDRDVTVRQAECRRLDGVVHQLTESFYNLNAHLHQYLPTVTEETENATRGIAMLQVHLKDDYLVSGHELIWLETLTNWKLRNFKHWHSGSAHGPICMKTASRNTGGRSNSLLQPSPSPPSRAALPFSWLCGLPLNGQSKIIFSVPRNGRKGRRRLKRRKLLVW